MKSAFDEEIELKVLDDIDKEGAYEEYEFKIKNQSKDENSNGSTLVNTDSAL